MTANTYTESQVQMLADIWRRRAAADRRDYGDMQANRIELCVDELLSMVPQINEALCYPARILELEECRKKGWNDSAPAYRAGWNECCDSVASIIAPHSDVGALTEQADAWNAVVETLNKVSPGWQFNDAGTGLECACAEITALAERQAARSVVVSDEDAMFNTFRLAYRDQNKSLAPMLESFRRAYKAAFAQSHGVAGAVKVPDARALHVRHASKDEPQFDPEDFTQVDTRVYFWRVGWNACRSAMLDASTQEKAL